jgi:two-component system, OmpR family, osmolarity sensor histidine kinase EnvZ
MTRRPRSLSHRLIALVLSVSLTALVVHSVILAFMLRPLGIEPAGRVTLQLRSVITALRFIPEAKRDAFAAELSTDGLRIGRSQHGAGEEGGRDTTKFVAQLSAALGKAVERIERVDYNGAAGFEFELRVDGSTWWIWLPRPRQPLTWLPIVTLVSISLIALVTQLAALHLFTRPLSALAAQIHDRRHDLRQIEEPANVSAEVQEVIRSFNALVQSEEQSRRTRQNLLAGVSHDLRTPLARLRLRAETECPDTVWLAMEPDFLAVARIVDQFLAYAQGQNASGSTHLVPLREVVEDAIAQAQRDDWPVLLHEAEGTDCHVPELPLRRAMANLLDNARSHGRAPISLELTAVGEEIILVVFDGGCGISAADFEQAQEPFVRLGAPSIADGHCGLGLAIVALVAAQLGGRMVLRPFDDVRSGVGFAWPRPHRA